MMKWLLFLATLGFAYSFVEESIATKDKKGRIVMILSGLISFVAAVLIAIYF